MKVLIGTTNPSKIEWIKSMIEEYGYEIITLNDIKDYCEPNETGQTPQENAMIKAKHYEQYCDRVICNDSGLYLDCLDIHDPLQPGLHIKTPQGVKLSEEGMIEYYSALAAKFGGKVLAYYMNGFAINNCGTISSFLEGRESAKDRSFYLVDKVSPNRHKGWPLDSISVNKDENTYFVDDTTPLQDDEFQLHRTQRFGKMINEYLSKKSND